MNGGQAAQEEEEMRAFLCEWFVPLGAVKVINSFASFLSLYPPPTLRLPGRTPSVAKQ